MPRLAATAVRELDPYALMAVLGKQVIHPGGRESTGRLVRWADVRPGERVLDIGCGVGTTAVLLAVEHGARVVAADISPLMRERALANVERAGAADRVSVEAADIEDLPYPDASFDVVLAEAVTMFVDRSRAAAELVRVVRPGGRVLATEFCWRRPPTERAREAFLGEVCPGLLIDTSEEWAEIYRSAGLVDVQTESGPFAMMTARGMVADEGLNTFAFLGRTMSRLVYLRRMVWLMPRISRAVPYLGYVVVTARRPVPA